MSCLSSGEYLVTYCKSEIAFVLDSVYVARWDRQMDGCLIMLSTLVLLIYLNQALTDFGK